MKRAGFTMIELIFVIVILGILAAVAIPKLAATRDDAKIASIATEAATAVTDFGAYYTAQGSFATAAQGGAANMSNVFAGDATDMNATGASVTIPGADCISFNSEASVAGAGSDTLNVKYTTTTDAVCKGVALASASLFGKDTASWDATSDANLSHRFGGSSVKW